MNEGLLRSPAGASSLATRLVLDTRTAGGLQTACRQYPGTPPNPVGASLLAMTAAQPASPVLIHRYREQARSHSGTVVFAISGYATQPCGSELELA